MNALHSWIRLGLIAAVLWALCWSAWMSVAYADEQPGAIGSGLVLQLPALRADAPDAAPAPADDPQPTVTTLPNPPQQEAAAPPPPIPAPVTTMPVTITPHGGPPSNSTSGITTPEPRG